MLRKCCSAVVLIVAVFHAPPAFSGQKLPVVAGTSLRCDQKNNDTPTHSGNLQYAWDFSLNGTSGNADLGLPVTATEDGIVVYAQDYNPGVQDAWGNCVVIKFSDGQYGLLAHLQQIFVKKNESVKKGQVVATLGNADGYYANGAHIHYQRQNGSTPNAVSVASTFEDAGNPVNGEVDESQSTGRFDSEFNSNGGSGSYGTQQNPFGTYVGVHWHYHPYTSYPTLYRTNNLANNCYVQNWAGSTYSTCGIVYDALGGARRAYTVRNGFYHDSNNQGWNDRGGPNSDLGMPLTNEYSYSGGARQDFQSGYLRYQQGHAPTEVWFTSYTSPGWTSSGWNNQFSYLMAMAYDRNGRDPTVGHATGNSTSSSFTAPGTTSSYYKQNFTGGSNGDGAIFYHPDNAVKNVLATNEAYYLYGNFWDKWNQLGGADVCGVPTRDWYTSRDPEHWDQTATYPLQNFMLANGEQHYMILKNGVVEWHSSYKCNWVTQNPFTVSLLPGQMATFSVTYKNSGNTVWDGVGADPDDPYSIELRSCDSNGNLQDSWLYKSAGTSPWLSAQRVCVLDQATVAAGDQGTFTFLVQVPLTKAPGVYRQYFRPYHTTGGLIDDWGGYYVEVTVLDPSRYQAFTGKFNTDTKWDIGVWDKVNGDWSIALRDASVNQFNPAGYWLMDWAAGMGQYQLLTGDFSGDGYTDICVYRPDLGRWWVAYNQGTSFVQQNGPGPNGCWIDNWATGNGWVPLVGDFSGDGVADIAVYYPSLGRWFVAYNQGSRFEASNGPNTNGSWLDSWAQETGEQWKVFSADVSGDHYADVIAYSPLYGRWFVAYNQGGRFQNASGPATNGSWITNWATEDGSQWRCFVTDLSGDGYADLLAYTPIYGRWFVAYNQGGYFNGASGPATNGSWLDNWALEQNGSLWQVMTGNVSGDNVDDLVVFTPQTGRWFVAYNQGGQFIGESGLATAGSWLDNWGKLGQGVPPTRARPVPKEVPLQFSFSLAPNPVTQDAEIKFTLPAADRVSICTYDVNGREVSKIPETSYTAGQHSISWGRSSQGRSRLPAGIYFIRFTSHLHTATQKIVVVN